MHVMVTGATAGAGREIARLLDQGGHQLSLIGPRLNSRHTSDGSANWLDNHQISSHCQADLSSFQQFVEQAEECFGPIQLLINCVGCCCDNGDGLQLDLRELERRHQNHCSASICALQVVLPAMLERRLGGLVNLIAIESASLQGVSCFSGAQTALLSHLTLIEEQLSARNIIHETYQLEAGVPVPHLFLKTIGPLLKMLEAEERVMA